MVLDLKKTPQVLLDMIRYMHANPPGDDNVFDCLLLESLMNSVSFGKTSNEHLANTYLNMRKREGFPIRHRYSTPLRGYEVVWEPSPALAPYSLPAFECVESLRVYMVQGVVFGA
jgi:hypothetical protein